MIESSDSEDDGPPPAKMQAIEFIDAHLDMLIALEEAEDRAGFEAKQNLDSASSTRVSNMWVERFNAYRTKVLKSRFVHTRVLLVLR